jgi:glycosyltransferase involved in cell wall biosynthesis
MHLLLASVSSVTSPSGVCRHVANIARGALEHSSVSGVTLLTGEWQAGYFRDAFGLDSKRLEIRPMAIANSPVARNLWYLRELPAIARKCSADVVHLAFPMPVMRSSYAAPVVVSLHDLYPFDMPLNFGRQKARLNRAALRVCVRNVDALACVSEATRTRLHQLFPALDRKRTSVVPNAVYLSPDRAEALLPDAIQDGPFLLCVAQHRANKNLPLLLRAFRLALQRNDVPRTMKLVIVGNDGPETETIHAAVAECGLASRTIFLSGISDGLLAVLYARCEMVVAPSLLEGFGLPVAEALAAKCRVVCSDIAAFRAVGDTACVYFNPADDSGESLVAALRKAFRMPRKATTSPHFLDPQQAAEMYLALYSKLMSSGPMHHFEPSPADLSAPGDL